MDVDRPAFFDEEGGWILAVESAISSRTLWRKIPCCSHQLGRNRAHAFLDWLNSRVSQSTPRLTGQGAGGLSAWQGGSLLKSRARHPYLSNVCPVSLAALAMPQPEKARQASRAIAILIASLSCTAAESGRADRSLPHVTEMWPSWTAQSASAQAEAGRSARHTAGQDQARPEVLKVVANRE